jgi:putative restriction endonuclease
VRKIKYFTKDLLIEANDEAVRSRRNRTLYEDKLATLPDLRFPVGFTMIHNDCEMRVQITLARSMDGPFGQVWLDIPFETYNALPETEVPE